MRPKGLERLPREGMIPSSGRYIIGPLAAQNESPFLEGRFLGIRRRTGERSATEAYSAKYGVAPAVSKLVIVELGKAPDGGRSTRASWLYFNEYLQDVRREGDRLEGRNQAGRWFLFETGGRRWPSSSSATRTARPPASRLGALFSRAAASSARHRSSA